MAEELSRSLLKAMSGRSWVGSVHEPDSSPHLAIDIDLHCRERIRSSIIGANTDAFRVVQRLAPVASLLYAGIAERQPLSERFHQHKVSYDAGPSNSSLGGRIRASRLRSQDIRFSWTVAENAQELRSLRVAEQTLAGLCNPRFSLR